MFGLDNEITNRYEIDISNAVPYKEGLILDSNKGRLFFKKSALYPARIMFIHGAKEHLYHNGFMHTDRYLCTKEGDPFINANGVNYLITVMVDGEECNFDKREDTVKAAKALAQMHKASKGYKLPKGSLQRTDLGNMPVYFRKRLDEIKKLKKIAKKGRSRFDYMFLEHADYFYNLGERTIREIANSGYEKLTARAKEEGVFCHHDYTHRNIIINREATSIINFEYCCFELKVYDLANLLRRKMRKCNWDIREAKVVVDSYRSVEEITEEEFFVMKLMLQFPQKLWRVINKFYNSKRGWSEKSYITMLHEVIEEMEGHKRFIERYELLM